MFRLASTPRPGRLRADGPALPSTPIRLGRRKPVRLADAVRAAAAATALCGGALLVLDTLFADHAADARTPAPARAASVEAALAPADPGAVARYVGHWVSDAGARMIVSRTGSIWADSGALLGRARLDGDASRLVFQGAGFRCSYRLVPDGSDGLDWTLLDGTPGTACPTGRYTRRFTF